MLSTGHILGEAPIGRSPLSLGPYQNVKTSHKGLFHYIESFVNNEKMIWSYVSSFIFLGVSYLVLSLECWKSHNLVYERFQMTKNEWRTMSFHPIMIKKLLQYVCIGCCWKFPHWGRTDFFYTRRCLCDGSPFSVFWPLLLDNSLSKF